MRSRTKKKLLDTRQMTWRNSTLSTTDEHSKATKTSCSKCQETERTVHTVPHIQTHELQCHTVKTYPSTRKLHLVSLWPWPLTLRTFPAMLTHMMTNCAQVVTAIPPLSTEILCHARQVLMVGQRQDGHTDRRLEDIMPLVAYCWRRRHRSNSVNGNKWTEKTTDNLTHPSVTCNYRRESNWKSEPKLLRLIEPKRT